jgi:hypothetical protein
MINLVSLYNIFIRSKNKMNINNSTTHIHLNSLLYHKSKYFDDESQKTVDFWEEKANYFKKSFVLSVFLSASPILLLLLLIFFLSCMANLLQKWMIIKRNENRFKKLEKYKILLELNQKYLEKCNVNNDDNSSLNISKEEEDGKAKIESNLKRKGTHAFGLSELYIPDENKVPIVLLNEAIARASIVGLSTNDEENNQIEFDPEIAHLINELCHPKFVLTDEDETNSIIEIIKSEDESHLKESKETKDSNSINSEEERIKYKSSRRKSSNRKIKVSKKTSKSSEEDEGFNIKSIGKMIRFKHKDSNSDTNSSSDNDNNCEIKIVKHNKDYENPKFPDVKIHIEDYDEINNKNDENTIKISFTNNRENFGTGVKNHSYEKEDV